MDWFLYDRDLHHERVCRHSLKFRKFLLNSLMSRDLDPRYHSFSTYAKFSGKEHTLPPDTYTDVCVSGDKKC